MKRKTMTIRVLATVTYSINEDDAQDMVGKKISFDKPGHVRETLRAEAANLRSILNAKICDIAPEFGGPSKVRVAAEVVKK